MSTHARAKMHPHRNEDVLTANSMDNRRRLLDDPAPSQASQPPQQAEPAPENPAGMGTCADVLVHEGGLYVRMCGYVSVLTGAYLDHAKKPLF
jgi:hypothetical protein